MAGRTSVAVLGAGGTMGLEMARNLARAGMEVRAWNRSRERATPLAAEGARITGSPAEAAQGAEAVAVSTGTCLAYPRPGDRLGS